MDEYDNFTKKECIIYFIIAAIIIFICIFFGGCATTQSTGNAGWSDAYIVGRLTESVDEFDRGINTAITKSRDITDAIDRIESLFSEYERAAIQLRDEVDSLRKQIQEKDECNNNRISNNSGSYNTGDYSDNSNNKGH